MENLLEILRGWCDSFNEEIDDSEINSLSEIYTDDFRHSYYELSEFLEKELGPDERDFLCSKLESLYQKVCEDKNNRDLQRGIFKLLDHVTLETIRLNRMLHIDFLADKAEKSLDETNKNQKNNQDKVDELSNKIQGFHGQTITILGIFTGIIIGFVAELKIIESGISALSQVGIMDTLLLIVGLGIIVINTLFALMYSVAALSDKSIAVSCKNKNCQNCRDSCMALKKAWRKYPYIFIFNVIFVVMFIILIVCK